MVHSCRQPQEKDIAGSCSTSRAEHECLNIFRENPAIVKILGYALSMKSNYNLCPGILFWGMCHLICNLRNWRILWSSLPRDQRLQMILNLMKDNPGVFRFAGVTVCSRAFIKLTKISAGTLQNARNKISQGVVQVWRADALSWMTMRNQSKAHRYLDARSWIESYAETHGENSPMSLQVFLPAGRKFFYHSQYEFERTLSTIVWGWVTHGLCFTT